ncbi:unnamed protein product (macronuclear) [Paramecium tetraurelia]|uniref:Chromosome undetermined scaffold_1, whole genome shotgun sequence n=1 Tax=Paramecium tetraurelia TaxID=5888 RepID=Q6BGE7_PARTE|nr:hypothetical protein [Paramecium tetraurelia strain d4-2]XP_001423432.1 uncharacterized protein GSPATT00000469001 [Paramecium tetraurelia]CAH03273.1 Conserved hypothetical protein [Paramecium tetraurelia]CAK56034.1 unnamed protein product [Paramecium tetraurelia]|eukprot:XP_001423432.1 hypothetical protein (macronuclear) [Paramecium tetraurelia strain d4-2]
MNHLSIQSDIFDQDLPQDMQQSFAIVTTHVGVPKVIEDCSQIPEIIQLKSGLMYSEQHRLIQLSKIQPQLSYLQGWEDKSAVLQNDQIRGLQSERTENNATLTSVIMQSGLFTHENFVQYEGFILKKTKKLLSPFKQIYCHFQDGILSFYQNQQKQKARFVLNLGLFNFQYYQKQNVNSDIYEFGLKCMNDDKIFQFKGLYNNQWFLLIKKFIDNVRQNPVVKFYLNPFSKYYKKRLITNDQFRQMCQTGDILLFQTKSYSSKLQRLVTRSNYDHVAMILKYQSGAIYVLEATDQNGVGIFDWDSMTNQLWYELYQMVVYRQLHLRRNIEFYSKLKNLLRRMLGDNTIQAFRNYFKKNLQQSLHRPRMKIQPIFALNLQQRYINQSDCLAKINLLINIGLDPFLMKKMIFNLRVVLSQMNIQSDLICERYVSLKLQFFIIFVVQYSSYKQIFSKKSSNLQIIRKLQ